MARGRDVPRRTGRRRRAKSTSKGNLVGVGDGESFVYKSEHVPKGRGEGRGKDVVERGKNEQTSSKLTRRGGEGEHKTGCIERKTNFQVDVFVQEQWSFRTRT